MSAKDIIDLTFNKNEDRMKLMISDVKKKLSNIHLGGGQKNIDKQHAKGKLTARERINYLVDKDTDTIEIGAFAGYEMYPEYGGCPSGGVVVEIGCIWQAMYNCCK
jgi:acetyl-CoA carboxylase carboxyltransferase component